MAVTWHGGHWVRGWRCSNEATGCQVTIVALDGDNVKVTKSFELGRHDALSTLQSAWAKIFEIPAHVVGFTDASQSVVELTSTPASLGWGATAELNAVPFEDEWADMDMDKEEKSTATVGAATAGDIVDLT